MICYFVELHKIVNFVIYCKGKGKLTLLLSKPSDKFKKQTKTYKEVINKKIAKVTPYNSHFDCEYKFNIKKLRKTKKKKNGFQIFVFKLELFFAIRLPPQYQLCCYHN